MARYKKNEFAQNLLIPISLQEQILPGSLEYTICTFMDKRMDMSLFDEKYCNDEMGSRAYDPRILLKVVLLGDDNLIALHTSGFVHILRVNSFEPEGVFGPDVSGNDKRDPKWESESIPPRGFLGFSF